MALDSEFIGGRIRSVREIHDMTQKKFAEKMHMTQQTLSRYENGTTPIPYTELANISVQFSVPVGYFFGLDTEGVSGEELILVEYYRKIDERLKRRALELMKTLSEEFPGSG